MSGIDKLQRNYISHEDAPRDRDLFRTKRNTALFMEAEKTSSEVWAIQNSPLLRSGEKGADPSYESTFAKLLPEGVDLKTYIEDALAAREGHAIAIDIGGLGSQVFKEFKPGFFERTTGVAFNDTRELEGVNVHEDTLRHHTVIEGDFFKQETRQKIQEWLAEEKADLILERMEGGLALIPRDPRLLRESLRILYASLSKNGLLFLQTAYRVQAEDGYKLFHDMATEDWAHVIANDPEARIVVRSTKNALLIQKLEDSPDELPHLDMLY